MIEFISPIFGPTRDATDIERKEVARFVQAVPVCVFQELNKKIRESGLTILITREGEYLFFGAYIDYNNGLGVYLRNKDDIENNAKHLEVNERITYLYSGPKP